MDFSNESYVRVYTRDTATWNRLGWEGQTVLMHLLRRVDRAGHYPLAGWDPAEALAHACRGPEEFFRIGLQRCLDMKVVVHTNEMLTIPRFRAAQTSRKTNQQRQRDLRETRRALGADSEPLADQTTLDYTPDSPSETDSNDSLHLDHNELLHVTNSVQLKAKQSKEEDLRSSSFSAEQPACQVVELRDRPKALAATGYRWLDATLGGAGRAPDLIAWQPHYERIGAKPPNERALVAKHLMQTPYIVECLNKAKPDHILRFWNDFVSGPRFGYKPPHKHNPGLPSATHDSDEQALRYGLVDEAAQ